MSLAVEKPPAPPSLDRDGHPVIHVEEEGGTHTVCGLEIAHRVKGAEANCVVCLNA